MLHPTLSPLIDGRPPPGRPSLEQRRAMQIEADGEMTSSGPLDIAGQVMKRLLTSTVHGFTTINFDRSLPESTAEGIAQSIGMWIGITGTFVPIAGKVGWGIKAGAGATRTFAGAVGRRMGVRASTASTQAAKVAGKARRQQLDEAWRNLPGRWTSAPIWLGDKAVEGAGVVARKMGMGGASARHAYSMDFAKGAVRIGTAMGSAGWQEGFEGMAWGAGFGVFFGGSDRVIGNVVRQMRPRIQAQFKSTQIRPGMDASQQAAAKLSLERVERGISAVSAGIVSGSPSTMMGLPWEYQLYDYMFGAWLGAEPPYARRVAHQFVDKMRVKQQYKLMSGAEELSKTPEHQALMKRHKSERVRELINEEIDTQIDFRMGQLLQGWSHVGFITHALRNEAVSPAQRKEMQRYVDEITVLGENYDRADEYWTRQGLSEGAAHEAALINARAAYARFLEGTTPSRADLGLTDDIRAWKPADTGYRDLHPVKVKIDGRWIVGVVTRTDKKGRAIEVVGKDGLHLVSAEYGKGGKLAVGKRATPRSLRTQQAASRWKMTQFTQGEFVDMVRMETPGDPIPLSLWGKFPQVRDANTRTVDGVDGKGNKVVKLMLGERTLFYSTPYGGPLARSSQFTDYATALKQVNEFKMRFQEAETVKGIRELDASEIWKTSRTFDDATTLKRIDSMREVAKKINLHAGTDDTLTVIRTYRRLTEIYSSMTDDAGNLLKHENPWGHFTDLVGESFPRFKELLAEDPDALAGIRNWFRTAQMGREKVQYAWREQPDGTWKMSRIHDTFYDGKHAAQVKAPSFLQRTLKAKGIDAEVVHIDRVEGVQRDKARQPIRNYSRSLDKAHVKDKSVTGLGEADFYNMVWSLFNNPQDFGGTTYYIMGGVKDKDTLRALPMLFAQYASDPLGNPRMRTHQNLAKREVAPLTDYKAGELRPESPAREFLLKRINQLSKEAKRIAKSDPEKAKWLQGFLKDYQAEKQRFMDDIQQHIDMGEGSLMRSNLIKAEDLFDMMFASEIKTWEWLHSDVTSGRKGEYPLTHILTTDGFLNSAVDRNKRLQIIDAEGSHADIAFYHDLPGVKDGKFRALMVNTVNRKKGLGAVKDMEDLAMWTRTKDGEVERVPDDALRDGYVLLHPRLFRRMGQDTGVEDFGSAIKGFTAFSDKHGMFLGKYAMFEGTEAAARAMDKAGVSAMYYTSAVKVGGKRKAYDMQVDGEHTMLYGEDGMLATRPETYNIPLDSVTFTAGKADIISKALESQRLAVQLIQSLSSHLVDPTITNNLVNSMLQEAYRSTRESADIMKSMMDLEMMKLDPGVRAAKVKELGERVQALDVDTLGIHDIDMVLRGEQAFVESGLYDKVVRHIMGQHTNTDNVDRASMIDEVHDALFHTYRGAADIIMGTADRHLTPALMESRGVYHLMQQMKGDYFYERLARPYMDFSMKSILSGHDPWTTQTYGNIAEGTFMMGRGAQGMNVMSEGARTTLGKLWQAYQGARNRAQELRELTTPTKEMAEELRSLQAKIKRLEGDLDVVVARVPIDNAAGVRALRFAGFTDDVGTTSRLHPYDMYNLGGADVDIDDIFIYQNLGKERHKGRNLIDELRRPEVKDRWLETDEQGRMLRTELKSQETKDALGIKEEQTSSPVNLFSPRANFMVARRTAEANANVGVIADGKRDIMAYIDLMRSHGANETYAIKFLLDNYEFGDKITNAVKALERKGMRHVRFRVDPDAIPQIEHMLSGALNLMVDASNYSAFGDPQAGLQNIFSRGLIFEATADPSMKGGWQATSIRFGETPVYKMMKQAAKYFKGRDHANQRKYDFTTRVMHLQDLNARFTRQTEHATGKSMNLAEVPGSFYKAVHSMATNVRVEMTPFGEMSTNKLSQMYELYNRIMGEDTEVGRLVAHATSQVRDTDARRMEGEAQRQSQFEQARREQAQAEGRVYRAAEEGRTMSEKMKSDLEYLYARHRQVSFAEMQRSIEAYNRILADPEASTSIKLEAYTRMKDFIANDMADMVSAIALYREVSAMLKPVKRTVKKVLDGKEYDVVEIVSQMQLPDPKAPPGSDKTIPVSMTQLQGIASQISDFKYNWYYIMQYKKAATDQGRAEAEQALLRQKSQTKEALEQDIADYRASLEAPELRRFMDMYALGTFVTRSYDTRYLVYNPFLAHIQPQNARDYFKVYEAFYKIGRLPASELKGERIMKLLTSDSSDLEAMLRNSRSGNAEQATPISHTVDNIKRRYREYHKKGGPKLQRKGVQDTPAHYVYWQDPNFLKAFKEWTPTERDLHIMKEMRTLFSEHPQLQPIFETIFEGIQNYDLGRLAYSLEDASYEDIRHVMGVLKGYRHGNLLAKMTAELPTDVDWTLYYAMPNRYHERMARFDLLTKPREGMVVTREGKAQLKTVRILTSTPNDIKGMADNVSLKVQIRMGELTEKFKQAEHAIFGEMDPAKLKPIWNYAVMRRLEMGRRQEDPFFSGRPQTQAADWEAAQYKHWQAEMNKMIEQGEMFTLQGEQVTPLQVMDRVDAFIRDILTSYKDNVIDGPNKAEYEIWSDRTLGILDTDAIFAKLDANLSSSVLADMDFPGFDLIHRLSHQYMMEKRLVKEGYRKADRDDFNAILSYRLQQYPIEAYQPIDPAYFYPKTNFDTKHAKQIARLRFKEMIELGYSKERAAEIIEQEFGFLNDISAKADRNFNELADLVLNVSEDIRIETVERLRSFEIPDVLKGIETRDGRTNERMAIGGWDPGPKALLTLMESSLSKGMYKMLGVTAAKQIDDYQARLTERDPGHLTAEGRSPWADFLRMYVRDQVGTTTELPRSWYDAYPELGVRRSKYGMFTDTYYRRLDIKISKFFGTRPLLQENNPDRAWRLVSLANAEAKFSLMTLLSRPKALFTNLYGGNQLAAIDVGVSTWSRALQLKELQRLDPSIKTYRDAMLIAEKSGAMESLIYTEVKTSAHWKNARYRKGLSEVMAKIKGDPMLSDQSIWNILRAHGIPDIVIRAAAAPMRYSERMLRTHSFLAHVLKYADVMEHTGGSPFKNEWVMEMARRGVVSSQFLYNNANRPAFSRTNMGKIYTRFKLWAMNSVQFRTLAAQRAAEVGFQEGTEARIRFERMLISDMFMFALAALFPFTLFATALPEPYGWLKDLVQWAFGDDDDKAGTFFGALPPSIAPLNIALPPSSRVLTTWFQPMLSGDWDQFMGYHVWSFFPFGLLARDVKRSIDMPGRTLRNLSGIPANEMMDHTMNLSQGQSSRRTSVLGEDGPVAEPEL